MRAFVAGVVYASLAAAGMLFASPPAQADTECQVTDPQTGLCTIWVEVPPTPSEPGDDADDGPADTGSGQGCYWDPAKQGLSRPPAGPVACRTEAGYWSNAYTCYISPAKPQPPAGDPAWQGHEHGDGAVYFCYQPQTGILISVWAQDPPGDSGTGPTPRQVAQVAIDSMALRAIDIGITPKPAPDSVGIVGMPVWMWAANPDEHTFGPATASASAGGITVTATARVQQITWDMGDGTDVVCRTPGTPYQPRFGRRQSPDCGHVYERTSAYRGGQYTVSASSDWVVTWEGAGQTGTIRLNGLVRSVQITVGEAQVLVE